MLVNKYQPDQPAGEAEGESTAGKEIVMKAIGAILVALLVTGAQAMASTGAGNDQGMGNLATFFVAFFVLIIFFQFIPGVALFVAMVKGIFSREIRKPAEAVEAARSNH